VQAWNAWFARRLGGGDPWFQGRLLLNNQFMR
jgi:hypothetical protein